MKKALIAAALIAGMTIVTGTFASAKTSQDIANAGNGTAHVLSSYMTSGEGTHDLHNVPSNK